MVKIKITPSLISNPIVIIWLIYALIVLFNSDGMAPMMATVFFYILLGSAALLVVDRLIVDR